MILNDKSIEDTNISNGVAQKRWASNSYPVFVLLDNEKHQYSQFAAVYAPQSSSDLASNNSHLPGVTLTMVYVFDKFDGYTPETIEIFIDGQKYPETFKLR